MAPADETLTSVRDHRFFLLVGTAADGTHRHRAHGHPPHRRRPRGGPPLLRPGVRRPRRQARRPPPGPPRGQAPGRGPHPRDQPARPPRRRRRHRPGLPGPLHRLRPRDPLSTGTPFSAVDRATQGRLRAAAHTPPCTARSTALRNATGGWVYGITHGSSHKNVERRVRQFAADPATCLRLACGLVHAKIKNARVLLRRNHPSPDLADLKSMKRLAAQALRTDNLQSLLGVEGLAARDDFGQLPASSRPPGSPSSPSASRPATDAPPPTPSTPSSPSATRSSPRTSPSPPRPSASTPTAASTTSSATASPPSPSTSWRSSAPSSSTPPSSPPSEVVHRPCPVGNCA